MSRTFVGFGFGPIQAGLFVHEALASGNFSRTVIAEIDARLVEAVCNNDGQFTLNIARHDGIRTVTHSGIEIYDPKTPKGREAVVQAIADADELATAVPKVDFYSSNEGNGIDDLLREGLRRKIAMAHPRQAVIYTAENNNRAAEILEEKVLGGVPTSEAHRVRSNVQFLNTVIGKMSQRVDDPKEIAALQLGSITPESSAAFLVEAFRNILVSQIALKGYERGITAFMEKPDLLPFEEAKLYGHNAIHALMGYLAAMKGYEYMSNIQPGDGIMKIGRQAFLEESGATLIRKHQGIDVLFTEEGYTAYADDLLVRMTNPYLRDTIQRVCRDPERKLGYHDRLIGLMRLALVHNVAPKWIGLGAAAALNYLDPNLKEEDIAPRLANLWNRKVSERDECLGYIKRGFNWLKHGQRSGEALGTYLA